MTPSLAFDQVVKIFGATRALDNLSFELQAGEVIGLLGHNGAGKTTCMKLALGLNRPTSGSVRVMGSDPAGRHSDALRQQLGFLPENVSFYQQLTGREALRYFARLKQASLNQVDQLLDEVGLMHAANRRIKTYSKGMRQRVGLAQARLGRPRLLLLDEPTAGLDPQATREFYSMLDGLRAEGVSILISSHVLPGIERHIDRAIILGQGRLLAQGSIESLRAEASLPMTIRARGDVAQLQDRELLERLGYSLCRVNAQHVEIQGLASNKIDAIRYLVNAPGIEDIELVQPSLEHLYAYFTHAVIQQEVD